MIMLWLNKYTIEELGTQFKYSMNNLLAYLSTYFKIVDTFVEAPTYFANLTAIAVSWMYLTLFSTLFYANHIYCKLLITLLP